MAGKTFQQQSDLVCKAQTNIIKRLEIFSKLAKKKVKNNPNIVGIIKKLSEH